MIYIKIIYNQTITDYVRYGFTPKDKYPFHSRKDAEETARRWQSFYTPSERLYQVVEE